MAELADLVLNADTSGLRRAGRDLDNLGDEADRTERRTGRATGAIAAGFKGIAAGAAAAIAATVGLGVASDTIAKFETSMAKLSAVSRATSKELQSMRDIAMKLGSTTEFSATQAADGLNFLAMAGFSASESVAAIPDVLNLATAAALDLGTAADISSNIMSAFAIAATDAASVTDVLAAASSRANTDVGQLGEAMGYVGPVASALGISVNDAAAAIGVLSDAGIQGSSAGTGLRRILSSLAGPTGEAAGALRAMGLELESLNPQTASIVEIVGQLSDAGLTAADALTIFGDRGGPAILALTSQVGGLRDLTGELSNVEGEATRMADTMRDSLGGDIQGLGSAVEGLILAIGEAGLTAALRSAVQGITAFVRGAALIVSQLADAYDAVEQFFSATARAGAAVDTITTALGDEFAAIESIVGALGDGSLASMESARAKLGEVEAIRAKITAMAEERAEMVKQTSEYQDLQAEILGVQQALAFMTNDRGNSAEAMGFAQMPIDLRIALDLLGDLEEKRVAMLGLVGEEREALAGVNAQIADIEGAIAAAASGQDVFNGRIIEGQSFSERLASALNESGRAAAGATTAAGALAQNLSVAAGQASALVANLGRVPAAMADLGGKVVSQIDAMRTANAALTMQIQDGTDARVAAAKAERDIVLNRMEVEGADMVAQTERIATMDRGIAQLEKLATQNSALTTTYSEQQRAALKLATATAGGSGGGGGSSGSVASAAKAAGEAVERAATEVEGFQKALEDAGTAAEDLGRNKARVLIGGVDGIADAWGDFVADGFRDFKGFTDSVLNTFKGMLSQMIAMAARNRIMIGLGIGGGAAGAAGAAQAAGGASGLLGGLGAFGGSIGSGFSSVLSGFGSGGFGGAASAIGSALSGATSSLAGLGTAIGAAIPVIGAVGLVFSAFKPKMKLLDAGITVAVDGMDTLIESFQEIEKRRLFGLLKSRRSSSTPFDADAAAPIQQAVDQVLGGVGTAADALGLMSGRLDQFAYELSISTKDLSDDQIQAAIADALRGMGDAATDLIVGASTEMVKVGERVAFGVDGWGMEDILETVTILAPAFSRLQREGESSSETLTRLADSLGAVNGVADTLGHAMQSASLRGGELASIIVDAAGGLDAFASSSQAYFSAFYSDQERLDVALRQLGARFDAIGAAMPATRDGFRALVEGLDTTTDAGAETYGQLIALAGAFAEVTPAIGSLSRSLALMFSSVSSEIDAILSDTSAAMQANQAAAQEWYRTADTLRSLIAEMRGTAGVLVSGQQATQFAQRRFDDLVSRTMAGDNAAATDLPRAARALIDASRTTARTALEQARVEARVLSSLQGAGGVADIEGARHDVIAGLQGRQVDILGQIRAAIQSGETVTAAQLAAFQSSLGSLDGAIAAVESISYADISARIDVVANATGLPAWLSDALGNAADGIQADVEFLVRAEGLTPDLRFIALNAASEHVATVEFLAENRMGRDLTSLALATSSTLSRTVRAVIASGIDVDAKRLALTAGSELTRTVRAALDRTGSDARALRLALDGIGSYAVAVRAALHPSISDETRQIVFEDGSSYSVAVNAALDLDGAQRRILLAQGGVYAVNVTAALATGMPPEMRRLVLEANTSAIRALTIAAVYADDLTPEDRDLLRKNATTALRTISATINPAGFTADNLLFLHELGRGTDSVKRVIEGSLTATMRDDVERGVLQQLTSGDGRVDRAIDGWLNAYLRDDRERGFFAQLTAGTGHVDRAIDGWVDVNLRPGLERGFLHQLTAGTGSVDRTVRALLDTSGVSPAEKSFLRALTGMDGTGKLTLAGGFQLDPSSAFQTWFASTGRQQFGAPMEALQGSLAALRDAVLSETADRKAAEARQAALAKAQGALADAAAKSDRITTMATRIIADIEALEKATGVQLTKYGRDAGIGIGADGSIQYDATEATFSAGSDIQKFRDVFFGQNGLMEQLVGLTGEPGKVRARMEALRANIIALGGVPAFAGGGMHMGGMRLVGENGPELEVTGPSRIYSAPQTAAMMRGGGMDAEAKQLLREIRDQGRQMDERDRQISPKQLFVLEKMADYFDQWDIDGLPAERATA